MSQNDPLRTIWSGVTSRCAWWTCARSFASFSFHPSGAHPSGGLTMNSAATITTRPWMIPQVTRVWAYPEVLIIRAMGATVSAVPTP